MPLNGQGNLDTCDPGTSELSSCPLTTGDTWGGRPTRGFPGWTSNSKSTILKNAHSSDHFHRKVHVNFVFQVLNS